MPESPPTHGVVKKDRYERDGQEPIPRAGKAGGGLPFRETSSTAWITPGDISMGVSPCSLNKTGYRKTAYSGRPKGSRDSDESEKKGVAQPEPTRRPAPHPGKKAREGRPDRETLTLARKETKDKRLLEGKNGLFAQLDPGHGIWNLDTYYWK